MPDQMIMFGRNEMERSLLKKGVFSVPGFLTFTVTRYTKSRHPTPYSKEPYAKDKKLVKISVSLDKKWNAQLKKKII